MDLKKESLKLHKKLRGKIEIKTKGNIRKELALQYTPGVAYPSLEISKNKELVYEYTSKGNNVAIVSDGTRLLGLGNRGAFAALPVMEGKAFLFKELGGVDAFPLCLSTQDPDEIIRVVQAISPSFAGINLEDIESPKCFYIYKRLKETLDIPVFHDDQDGTALVTLAALINALNVVKKDKRVKIVVIGAGAAGLAITHLLFDYGFKNILPFDSQGLIYQGRSNLNPYKGEVAESLGLKKECDLEGALMNADVLIAASGKANSLEVNHLKMMNKNAIVFVLSNPEPEITFEKARKAGVRVAASGGSGGYKNHVNNLLAFPFVFRAALDLRAKKITRPMIFAAAEALASFVKRPSENKLLPSPFDKGLKEFVVKKIKAHSSK